MKTTCLLGVGLVLFAVSPASAQFNLGGSLSGGWNQLTSGAQHASGVISSGAKHSEQVISSAGQHAGGVLSSGSQHAGGVASTIAKNPASVGKQLGTYAPPIKLPNISPS